MHNLSLLKQSDLLTVRIYLTIIGSYVENMCREDGVNKSRKIGGVKQSVYVWI